MHRISTSDHTAWFVLRMPPEASASFRKKSKSFFVTFLSYCYTQGWITADVLVAADQMDVGELAEDQRWLTPEQLAIFDHVVATSEAIDAYERFVWETYRDTGIRTFEGRELTPESLDLTKQKPGVLHLDHGKGRGDGKKRDIPVADAYINSYLLHVQKHHLRPRHYVLFQRRWLLLKGEKDVMGWVSDYTTPATNKAINGVFGRIQDQVNRLVISGEISPRVVPLWKLTAKVMRKTYACNQLILTRLAQGGMDLLQLQKALGHTSLTTTKTYLADVDEYLDQNIKRVSTGGAAQLIIRKRAERDAAS